MKKKPKTGILQRFFKIICLAVTLTSAGFLIYHMVYLPMENKKLVAELKGNFPEPEAPGASGSEKKDQPAGRKMPGGCGRPCFSSGTIPGCAGMADNTGYRD